MKTTASCAACRESRDINDFPGALELQTKTQSLASIAYGDDPLGRLMPGTVGGAVTTNYIWCGAQLCQAQTSAGAVARAYYAEGELLISYAYDAAGRPTNECVLGRPIARRAPGRKSAQPAAEAPRLR